ncbi:facilitated trehalose transporter Tret1-like [Atheta coriaria]|uniref:facilitated trehalose transporter Tret1-like n=1 Tax=Dalotia coriaria TaxID=877792 RepID=UPI0031F36714
MPLHLNYQYAAMAAGSLMGIAVGANAGWSSPYLPYLLGEDSHIPMTEDEGFWCAVASLLGAPIGSSIASMLIDTTGRRRFILSLAPISFLSYILIAMATDVWTLIAARVAIGATEGALYIALPMYYGEISDPKIRGFISSSVSVAALLGTILINIIGPFVSITTTGFICSVFPFLHMISFWAMPDSPYYLIKKGDLEGARHSLVILRGHKDVDTELDEIHMAVTRQENTKDSNASYLDLFTVTSNRRAFIIYCILCFTNKYSGKSPVTFYTTIIFAQADGILDPVLSTITFYIVGMITTLIGMCVVDKFGRRPMLLFSAVGCSIALAACGAYFALQTFASGYVQYVTWLPIVSLITYNMIFSCGLSFGPVLFLSELFPTSVKAKALFLGDTTSVVMATTASKFFQVSSDQLGMYVPFSSFAICTFLGACMIYLYVPETKGKTLEQIQVELIGSDVYLKEQIYTDEKCKA